MAFTRRIGSKSDQYLAPRLVVVAAMLRASGSAGVGCDVEREVSHVAGVDLKRRHQRCPHWLLPKDHTGDVLQRHSEFCGLGRRYG